MVRERGRSAVSGKGIAGWLLFDWATQPVFTLITTFIFAPYFAAHFIGDPVLGQAYWGYGTAAAGVIIAIGSPLLGAIADVTGRRKPWIAAFSILLLVGGFMLMQAAPFQADAALSTSVPHRSFDALVLYVLAGYVLVIVGAEFATVFTNAMMPDLVGPAHLGRLSGYGWAMGYAGGFVALMAILVFVIADAETGLTLMGMTPIFELDPTFYDGERATGPFSALWYALFVLPLFLFTPDRPRNRAVTWVEAASRGLRDVLTGLRDARRDRPFFLYLLAHMVYIDGLIALFAFGGIYAAGIFGWTTTELGLFGILLTITGTAGAVLGGVLNDHMGSIRVIIGSIVLLILCCLAILSIDRTHILFMVPVTPTIAELSYYAVGGLLGALAGPLQSASRTYLAEIAPADQRTRAYGLYAMSGKVTSFAGPLAVGVLTSLTGSQRIGISATIAFLGLGLWLLVLASAARRN